MNSALLIVAAGKSSRFGGYPKALCNVGSKMNVENTIEYASKVFDSIYLGLNVETVAKYSDLKINGKILSIETGQGDALSLIKLVRLVLQDNANIDKLFVCWGDAFFVDELPFVELMNQINDNDYYVACSVDEKPYAWFDVDEDNNVISSHFKKIDGEIEEGIHDQSLFCFSPNELMKYIDEYRLSIGVMSEDYDENEPKEVKLLDLFNYLYKIDKPVKVALISKNKVLSFNTTEELDKIIGEYCD